ncbi:GNAT family N-acetyltransferase [Rubellimicrobium rubrum]|uniref:GNAT family N-acetyltransferase n=1 Tax=Rubellimicrobium rubrum TaxID=2585369 RepID=A0A5C4N172_9RHOB|nr:GNAT family N-acetyltransferase [Rubellimicrobium rubrum]TNC51885.1 GNAT family N-acetyltransferase [Rubellimicrobium rubrum]
MTPDALARLHAAAFEQDRPWNSDEFASLLAHPGTLLLGDERASILGRVILDEAEVLTLATHPDHRRLGLAAMLLARFEQEAAARGADRAFLEVAEDNAGARALYSGFGYSEAGRRPGYYLRGANAPVAALVLSCPLR